MYKNYSSRSRTTGPAGCCCSEGTGPIVIIRDLVSHISSQRSLSSFNDSNGPTGPTGPTGRIGRTGPIGPTGPNQITTYHAIIGDGSIANRVRIDENGGRSGTILAFDPQGVSYSLGNSTHTKWKLKETSSPYQTTVGVVGPGGAMYTTVQSSLNSGCCFVRVTDNTTDNNLTMPIGCSNVIVYVDPGVTWL